MHDSSFFNFTENSRVTRSSAKPPVNIYHVNHGTAAQVQVKSHVQSNERLKMDVNLPDKGKLYQLIVCIHLYIYMYSILWIT